MLYADIDRLRNVQRTERAVEAYTDRLQDLLDNAALAAYDRRSAIEAAVTRFDLLEEMSETFTPAQDEALMHAIARGENRDLHLIHCLLLQAKEAIVKRRLAGGV
jgi:chemotaxis regulatin CheY-phosphate phosphatase CheZ